jgi:putative FmdB family regulatory protein
MAENEYVCLDCGNRFLHNSSLFKRVEAKCPHCGSERVMKINPTSLYGFFGGGG